MRLIPICVLALVTSPAHAAPRVTDTVLGRLTGTWTVTGATRGESTSTGAEASTVFGGAFVELHIRDPRRLQGYEARVFFGETEDGKLTVHWLDATGGDTARTLGLGELRGDVVTFTFPYPDGEFRDRLSYDRARDRWRLLIEMGPLATPRVFSDWYFDRRPTR